MNSPTVNNGWLGSEAFNDLQRLLKGLNAQQIIDGFENTHILISGATRTAPLWRSGNGIAEIRYGELLHQLMEMGFTLTQVGATNPTAMATSSSTWLEGVLEKNIQLVAGGLGEFFQGLNGTVSKWNYYNPMYATGWVSYDNTFTNALDYGQRLMKVAAAVDDPILDAEVLKSDVLSKLVNLGGAYAALNPRNDGNLSFFLDTANRYSPNANIDGDELERFLGTVPTAMVDQVLQLSGKLLLALRDVSAAKPFVNDPAFIDRHLRLARDFVILNQESPLIEPAKTSLALLDRAKTTQEVRIVAQRMQDETVKLLSSTSIGGDNDDTSYVRQAFIVNDSDSLQLKSILTTETTQFNLPDYRIFDIQIAGQNTSYLRAISLNKEDLGWITDTDYSFLPEFYVLRNGEIYYCPSETQFQFQSGDKWIIPRLFPSQNSPELLSTQEQATIKSGLEQISEISKPVGLFVAGALYQWAYDLGETGRSILTNLIPDWRKLDQRVEEDLPKDPMFITGRLLGNGAGVVTGLLGMISGGRAIAGGGSLCITGFGCFAGAPAIAVGSALVVAGAITIKEALENAFQNAQDLLSSGLNTFFSKDSSTIGSGSPLPPSRKSVNSLTSKYPGTRRADGTYANGLKQDEAYAIQDILERASTKKDGIIRITEAKVAQLFKSKQNKGNWPEAIIEKRNGTLVAIEVKNEVEVNIANVVDKFKTLVAVSNHPETGIGKTFSEFVLYINRDKFTSFKEKLYSVGRGNILLLEGKPYQVDGKTIQIKYSDFRPR